MSGSQNVWRYSVFSRILITFILIMIPIYALGISVYKWGIDTVRNQISSHMESQVSFYINNLESDIQRIRQIQLDCVTDNDINQLASIADSMSAINKTKAILRVQQRIRTMMNSSRYISNVRVYIPTLSRVILAEGSIDYIQEDDFSALKQSFFKTSSILKYSNNRLYLLVAAQFYDSSIDPLFIISVELSVKEISNTLQKYISSTSSSAFLTNIKGDYLINSANNEFDIRSMQDYVMQRSALSQSGIDFMKVGQIKYMVVYFASNPLDLALCQYIPDDVVLKPLKKYQLWFWIFTCISLVIIICFYLTTRNFLYKPMTKLIRSFKQVEGGDLEIVLEHNRNDEFRFLYHRFNIMVQKIQLLIEQVYKQKILAQHAELKQLQSQINPHFLYNSFYILQRMVKLEDIDAADKFANQLGNYFKYITRNSTDEVPLEKEVEHARVYTLIQEIRFQKRLAIIFEETPEQMKDIIVPRLILQPIIENAFEHGLKDKEKGGLLKISFYSNESYFCINVEDNGDMLSDTNILEMNTCLKDDYQKEVTGIINIHRRISLKFGGQSGINLSRGISGGLKVTILIEPTEYREGNDV